MRASEGRDGTCYAISHDAILVCKALLKVRITTLARFNKTVRVFTMRAGGLPIKLVHLFSSSRSLLNDSTHVPGSYGTVHAPPDPKPGYFLRLMSKVQISAKYSLTKLKCARQYMK